MRKAILVLLTLMFVASGITFSLATSNNGSAPVFTGLSDQAVARTSGTYDPLAGVDATDAEDGTISKNLITVIIVNLANDVITNQIDLSVDGSYRIEYEVKDSDLNLSIDSMLLTVGAGATLPDNTHMPSFVGVGTYKADLRAGTFDVMKGIRAYDYQGRDITDEVTYDIKALSVDQTVTSINMNKTEKYIITYRVADDFGNAAQVSRQVLIGDISPYVSSFSKFKGIGYIYDHDALNDYKLIWSDEFDVAGTPDASKWNYDIGTGVNGWGNWELQYYTNNAKNVTVKDGNMVITALKEDYGGMKYTSAKVTTRERFGFKYGIVEIRAKLPKGVGTWPALWMMPVGYVYGTWPTCGEIDIMEHVGYNQNKILGTVHNGAYNGTNGQQKGGYRYVGDASEAYHVYKIEWLPDVIKFFIDGSEYFEYRPSNYTNTPGNDVWPFDQEFSFNFNIAVGGMFGGVKGVDDSIWPQSMSIDYVRVYQSATVQNLRQLP